MATAANYYPDPLPLVTSAARPARRGMWAGLAVIMVSLLGLVAVMYALPDGYNARYWGINPLAVRHWAGHLEFTRPPALSAANWCAAFHVCLLTLWGGYAGLLVWAWRGGPLLAPRQTLMVTAAVAVLLASFAPPLLATDPYAYAAYARLSVIYGQNPYVTLPYTFLAAAHDPAQYFLAWNLPTVYGPVWTELSAALVKCLPHGWLWGEVLGLKLIAAAALCGLAWSAGRVAEQLSPGHGRWAMLAVGLNPLLLLEGPATGHNDLLMMAGVIGCADAFLRGRYARAGLWLGLAAGVKLLPLALLPWLIITLWRTVPSPRQRTRALCHLTGLTLLPSVLGYAFFWHGIDTFSALHSRTQTGHGTLLWAALAYAGLTVVLWKNPASWLTAWAAFCAVLMLTGMGFAFPWYIVWVWPGLLVQRGRAAIALSGGVGACALVWVSLYATLEPIRILTGH